MRRRVVMVGVSLVALVVLVLWRPMESGRLEGGGDRGGEHGRAAVGMAGGPSHGDRDARAAEGGAAGVPARVWWEVARGDADGGREEPAVMKLRTPSGAVRFVSAVVALDERGGDGAKRDDDDSDGAGEPSDLDDDHPGSYWKNLGYGSIRAVLKDLGIGAERAWVESAGGELLVAVRESGGGDGGVGRERLVVFSPEATPGDQDGDGVVSGIDLAGFLKQFGARRIEADVNEDGVVDQRDLMEFLRRWGEGAG